MTDWPATDCCPPTMDATTSCDPPAAIERLEMVLRVLNYDNRYATEEDVTDSGAVGVPVTDADRDLFAAACAVLVANLDIALWATCLIGEWSPEVEGFDLLGCIETLMTPDTTGIYPWHVTFVDGPDGGASMWAFNFADPASDGTVGVIVSTQLDRWMDQRGDWLTGGEPAFCAAVQVASEILHELVHICGDGYVNPSYDDPSPYDVPGTLHEDDELTEYPCWDEARMIASIFRWAMTGRYPCLNDSSLDCDCMQETYYFAASSNTSPQLRGTC